MRCLVQFKQDSVLHFLFCSGFSGPASRSRKGVTQLWGIHFLFLGKFCTTKFGSIHNVIKNIVIKFPSTYVYKVLMKHEWILHLDLALIQKTAHCAYAMENSGNLELSGSQALVVCRGHWTCTCAIDVRHCPWQHFPGGRDPKRLEN